MANIPQHLGVIMDGNGRWAQLRRRPRTFGHIKGARTAKKIITASRELGIRYLTLYAFSSENWLRPQVEVQFLMRLLSRYLKRETDNLIAQDIRFRVIGEMSRLPKDLAEAATQTMKATAHCQGMELIFALSYGARNELVEACKTLAQQVAHGEITADQITEEKISQYLQTSPAPDVDLIVRTSGEQRLSNFLLWQAAYSEFYFTKTLWPEFSKAELVHILENFGLRERRFGGVNSPVEKSDEQLSY